jgi:hypothetical protein
MRDFIDWQQHNLLSESRGLSPDRIGKKSFTDTRNNTWVLSDMEWVEKTAPTFTKRTMSVNGWAWGKNATCTSGNCGGVMLVTLKNGKKKFIIGKYTKNKSLKMGNDELRPLGFNSAGAGLADKLLRLNSQVFINGAKTAKIKYKDIESEWYVFTSAEQLIETIKGNLKSVKGIGDNRKLMDAIHKFLDGGATHFSWDGIDMENADRKKLGIYLCSELCCGIWALNGTPFGLPISKADRFMVPKSTSFSGVDSAFMSGKKFIPLSSKQSGGAKGGGAMPSFFNLTKDWQSKGKTPSDFKSPFLRDFYQFISSSPEIENRDSPSQIVYAYGVRKLFGLGKSAVPDPMVFYTELYNRYKKGVAFSKENAKWVKAAIAKIQAQFRDKWRSVLPGAVLKNVPIPESRMHESVLADIPLSEAKIDEFGTWISSVFTEIIAKKLEENPSDVVREVGCSNYYQLYLDGNKFISNGSVHFSIISSEKCGRVVFTGSKGAQTDIAKTNGWVNYGIKGN